MNIVSYSPGQRLLLRLVITATVVSLGGCGSPEPSSMATSTEPDAIPVRLTTVQEVNLSDPVIATGTMMPHKTTNITPMVSGLVETVYVAVGDRVKKGDALLRIRQTEIKLRIRELEQRVRLARAQVQDAERDLDTAQGLGRKGAVSRESTDNARTRLEVTQAELGIAQAQLEEARQNLIDTVSKAPFDGVITIRNVNEGTFVQTMRGGGGPPLLQIQKIDIIVTRVRIPETNLSRIHIGTPAKVTVDGLNRSFDTRINVINDWIDNQSRTIDIRLAIANKDYLIKPGLFARVEIYPEPRRALVVEREAVLGSENTYVFVNDHEIARKKSVEIRELDTQQVEITKGLVAGQQVVTGLNLTRLADGTRIRVE